MKNFIIGLILGILIGGSSIVWAYSVGVILQDENGNAVGTTSNPLHVEAI